jgi:uncharacterized protein (DUF2062 family)
VFKRRTPLSWLGRFGRAIYPRGGWARAFSYIAHRLRRLPDTPHKIARGIGAGVFVSFTPFFGFHFLLAFLLNMVLRGNLLAALLATFVGNPVTFPFIAGISLELGNWMLGRSHALPVRATVHAFGDAAVEFWRNVTAIFTPDPTHWESLAGFFDRVFLPYLVGGILPGLVAALAAYFFTIPIISAYQKHRRNRMKKKWDQMRARIAKSGDATDDAA